MCYEYQSLLYCKVAGHPPVGLQKMGTLKDNCNCGTVTVIYLDPCREAAFGARCGQCLQGSLTESLNQIWAERDTPGEGSGSDVDEIFSYFTTDPEESALSPAPTDGDGDLGVAVLASLQMPLDDVVRAVGEEVPTPELRTNPETFPDQMRRFPRGNFQHETQPSSEQVYLPEAPPPNQAQGQNQTLGPSVGGDNGMVDLDFGLTDAQLPAFDPLVGVEQATNAQTLNTGIGFEPQVPQPQAYQVYDTQPGLIAGAGQYGNADLGMMQDPSLALQMFQQQQQHQPGLANGLPYNQMIPFPPAPLGNNEAAARPTMVVNNYFFANNVSFAANNQQTQSPFPRQ
ncbi:hypothetical protein VTK56DRAFT_5462 [Thermocarpiscus australiensis]